LDRRYPRLSHLFLADSATTASYPLSLHDALPIFGPQVGCLRMTLFTGIIPTGRAPLHAHPHEEIVYILAGHGRLWIEDDQVGQLDRKSTRLNSSHLVISYAVFCLKKKIVESSAQH